MGNWYGKVEPAPDSENPESGRQNDLAEPSSIDEIFSHNHAGTGESPPNEKEYEHPDPDIEKYMEVPVSASRTTVLDGESYIESSSDKEEDPETDEPQTPISRFTRFWRQFLTVFFTPIFPRHRSIFYIMFEVLLPGLVAFIFFAAFTSGISWKQVYYNEADNNIFDFPELSMETAIANFREKHANGFGSVLIIYTPVSDLTTDIMHFTLERLGLDASNRVDRIARSSTGVIGAESEVELVERALYHHKERRGHGLPIGVVFQYNEDDIDEVTKLPYNLTYSILSFDASIQETVDNYPFVSPPKSKSWTSPYISSGFIGLQYALEQSVIRNVLVKQKEVEKRTINKAKARTKSIGPFNVSKHDSREKLEKKLLKHRSHILEEVEDLVNLPDLTLQMFTYANFRNASFRSFVTFSATIGLVVAYSFMSFLIVRQIVKENISGIKDLLQMHGLPHYIHWASLFFHALFFRAITSVLVVLALRTDFGHGGIIYAASPYVLFLMIWIHQISLTFMNFFIATWFKSTLLPGVTAVSCGILSFCLPESFYEIDLIGDATNYALMLVFPNWCLRHMMRTMIDHESDDKGVHWFNIMNIDYVGNKLSVGGGIFILIMTGCVYFVLAVYRDMTIANKLFPPTSKWYEFKERKQQKKKGRAHQLELKKAIAEGRDTDFEKPAIYEDPDPKKKCFVHIRHLSKRFGKHKVALDSISMNIYSQEITVILGHTGAGKTPLLAILSGMMMPSSGYAIIKGHDTNFESKGARNHVGLCTQRLVAFNLLTVQEHIILCHRLRGYSQDDCDRHCVSLLQRMNLWAIRGRIPGRIKVDELRRLDIALALVGSPEILLLDEPTIGLDPICRREIWDILLSIKHQHTIILTSPIVDEAEFLADRVALLSHGHLICFGSMDFLRQHYDTGYFLKLSQIPDAPPMNKNGIISMVKKHLDADATISLRNPTRIKEVDSLELELPCDQQKYFADICEELEKKSPTLSIKRVSIKRISLSDIFIKICSSVAADGNPADLYLRRDSTRDIRSALKSEIPSFPEKAERNQSRYFHIITLLKKRYTVFKSLKISSSLLYSLLSLFMIMVVLFQAKLFILPQPVNPRRMMNLQSYLARSGEEDLRVFYRDAKDNISINYANHLTEIIHPYGVKVEGPENMIGKLYQLLEGHRGQLGYLKEQHMVAFEFRRLGKVPEDLRFDFMGYFSSGALHSPSVALNIMNNVFLHAIHNVSNGRHYTVTANNNPMPAVLPLKYERSCGITCSLLALVMTFAIAFISHTCILVVEIERQSGMKHLQLMCGVHPFIYWIANYIVDAVIMFIVAVIIVLIFAADYYQTLSSPGVLGAIWSICTLYLMWSGMMWTYLMSTILPKSFNGFNSLALIHLFIGALPMMLFTMVPPEDGGVIFFRNILIYFFPPYTISSALYNFFNVASKRNVCKGTNKYVQMVCDVAKSTSHRHFVNTGHYISERVQLAAVAEQDVELTHCCKRVCLPSKTCYQAPSMFNSSSESWESPALLTDTLALFFQGFIYCGLLIMTERQIIPRLIQRVIMKFLEYRHETFRVPRKSRDVYQETLAVHVHSMYKGEGAGSQSQNVVSNGMDLHCVDLTKSTTTKMIMKDFCLEVKSGQCVAILGGGGAGKSCITNMIAGKVMPTTGNCYINGLSLTQGRKDYLSCIGYCPQQNYLFEELTGTQMLELMGCLRGVPEKVLNTHVQKWLSVFGLGEVANEKCKNYSVGLRQRLGAAMAFIGGPDIILLDEPTTAIDPQSRERLWAVIEHLNEEGHTILFTTYSSDEAFALAEKVAVIAEGNMQCVGNPEQLQSKYDRGHTLTFKLKHELLCTMELAAVTMTLLKDFKRKVLETFTHIDLLDEHDDRLMYFLRDARFTLGDIFRRAHFLATTYDILVHSYDVSESDIEDVFIFMTKKYHELDKPRKSDRSILDIIKQAGEPPFLKQQHAVTNLPTNTE